MTGPINPFCYSKTARFNTRKSTTDNYETPAWATEALILQLQELEIDIPSKILDPCAGRGAIDAEIKRLLPSADVRGADIREITMRKAIFCYVPLKFGVDFLNDPPAFPEAEAVIMNPPFTLADEMVLKALSMPSVRLVCCLQRTQYMEGQKRFDRLFKDHPESEIFHFISRVSMEQEGRARLISSGMMTFSWFVWRKVDGNWIKGPARLYRLQEKPYFDYDRRLVAYYNDNEIEVKSLPVLKQIHGYLYRCECQHCRFPLAARKARETDLNCIQCREFVRPYPADKRERAKFDQERRIA